MVSVWSVQNREVRECSGKCGAGSNLVRKWSGESQSPRFTAVASLIVIAHVVRTWLGFDWLPKSCKSLAGCVRLLFPQGTVHF